MDVHWIFCVIWEAIENENNNYYQVDLKGPKSDKSYFLFFIKIAFSIESFNFYLNQY